MTRLRAKLRSAAHALHRALADLEVPHAFIGGVAVIVHGAPRFTKDVDATVAYFGKAVILVTRIAAQAKSGEILASSVVRDLGESAHEVAFDEGREVELKGLSGKRRIYRVRWGDEPPPQVAPAAAAPPAESNLFRREGDYWTVVHEGRSFRLKDAKGLRYLTELLHHPGQGFRALDLAAGDSQRAKAADGDAGVILDSQAKSEYRERLEDLREEVDEAERFNDPERARRAREEIEFLSEELSRATGLGGRDRKAASTAERARLNVTMAIKAALKRIAENDAQLGRYLALTVKTGNVCTYTPDPRSPIVWHP